jgi:hypothetical protein
MGISGIIKGLLSLNKKVDIKKLPSQGIFYNDDLEIWVKKAEHTDIIEYEWGYKNDDLGDIIQRVKRIVRKNTILSGDYNYTNIKSMDIVFLFFEIVKFTTGKPILVNYKNVLSDEDEELEFGPDNFNYVDFSDFMDKYDNETKEFVINGFRYSVPCIGVENSLTNFLIWVSDTPNSNIYSEYSYDFIYFIGNKRELSYEEIENLIQIFNEELGDSDKEIIKDIVKSFGRISRYSLKKGSQIIDVSARIDLKNIWKSE